jgi:tetratricopeptide (TPR) repeat protein
MNRLLSLSTLCSFLVFATGAFAAQPLLVEDGRPRAEIVITEEPPRTTLLAAQELQTYLQKIAGAKLEIVTEPTGKTPVKIYVGRSDHTDRLKITAEDLKYGAYRIVSGDDWLVLIGDDTEFTPIEPWPRSNNDWVSGRVHAEWDKITGATWGNPLSQLRKHYTGSAGSFGKPGHKKFHDDGEVHVWGYDERGSFNAVCGLLRKLGVRWYWPGELGDVVPSMDSIPLPQIDETVRPDFEVRKFNIRFGVHGRDAAKWFMHLGVREPYGLQTAHGLHTMTHREEILRNHPDWFALYGGKRQNQPGQRLNQLCYSNEELLHETVRYVRAQFDHYDFDVVSVMPPDGYTAMCQCPLCKGKDSPERDYRGKLSDYVWDFVNRVAREVKKTHPDKMISNCAYGVYTLPPEKIDKLESNVQVIIVGGRRPRNNKPQEQEELRRLRAAWVAKTDNPIMIFENYPFTDRGWYLPAYVPHAQGESINDTKGISRGEDIWLSLGRGLDDGALGFNHFQVYFTARMYWGGKQQSVDELLDQYCRLFYGPAESQMKVFFLYCEDNWQEMEKDKAKVDRCFELLAAAQGRVEAESVYGRRIARIDQFLEALRNKGEQLARQRGPVPQVRLARGARDIAIDGKLDDAFWREAPVHAVGRLRELQTGRRPIYGTSFQAAWGDDGALYFAIRCEDHAGEPLNIGATRGEDSATWYGDVVEILLETEAHSYYQLAINPSGALVDLDRGAAKKSWFGWDSQAEVATQTADDHWTVEVRIPVVQDGNDPLHQVVGRKPSSSLPWHFNVCRQRIRDNGSEYSAFSPTGTASFHDVMKFGQLYEGRSHRFDHAEPEDDFLHKSAMAEQLMRERKYAAALEALTAIAGGKVTDVQKSAALQQAAACARALDNFEQAEQLAERAPLQSVAKTIQMQNLLAQRMPEALVERFQDEDIKSWEFWQAGEGYYLRGQAFSLTGDGKRAEADFVRSLELTTDNKARADVLLALGRNRESNLKDAAQALAAYRQIAGMNRNTGSATYFRGVQGAARILREQGKFDEALQALRVVDVGKLRGYWHGSLLVALGETLSAAGRNDEALAAYREALSDDGISAADRKAAVSAVEKLGSDTKP